MLVTPRNKKNLLDFFNNLFENLKIYLKVWVVGAGTFDLTNCFYFVTVVSTFDTASCVFL